MLNWIYPTTCELCHESAPLSICPDCLAGLERVPRPICLYCGATLTATPASSDSCPACAHLRRPFDLARSALCGNELNMELIYKLKYRHANYLAAALAPALAELWHSAPELHRDFAGATLVPVPITATHEQQRGYNQAAELTRALGKLLQLPVIPALQRHDTDHDSQTRLSNHQRRQNACRSFCPLPAFTTGRRTLPPRLVLVDDVFTTGATLRACSHALRQLPGVQHVAAITLIRAEHRTRHRGNQI